jgi:steroid 5-alpha reductase family enzyme
VRRAAACETSAVMRDRLLMLLAYLAAGTLAVLVWRYLPDTAPWARSLNASLAATGLLWLLGVLRGNPSVYDPYWSVAPIAVALAWAGDPGSAAASEPRQFLVLCLVGAWGLRLTYHWWHTFKGLGHEDWRYLEMRRSSGRLFPLVNLIVIHLLPTLMLLLACAAAYPALVTGTRPLGPIDAIAALWTLAAIVLEARSDRIMRAFRAAPRAPGQVCEAGPWGWLRHPNYLGELGFWWGLYLFSVAADPDAEWAALGPLVITSMLIFYSAPALDRRMAARYPAYRAYMRRVPSLLPHRPRSARGTP